MPRRAKLKPIFAVEEHMRMTAGRVMVMPTPTAEPFRAAMVGRRERWRARETRPPLVGGNKGG